MRILHILDHSAPLHSGYSFRTLAILRQQRARGWHTAHLTGAKQGAGDDNAPARTGGWHFFRTEPNPSWWARLPVLRQVAVIAGLTRRLRQVALLARPDILHAHSPVLNALAALRVGRALGLPVVYEIRAFWEDAAADHGTSRAGGLRYRLTRALENYALRRVDAITTICEGLSGDLRARGIAAHKITVIPNAVDAHAFAADGAAGAETAAGETAAADKAAGGRPATGEAAASGADAALRHRLGLDGCIVLGFIGSFYGYEGLELLVRTMPRMLVACPSLRLLLAGGGPREAALQELTTLLGLDDKVVFAGRVPHDDVAAYYRLTDMLVYPRLPMRLTELVTPLKPLEAMAQGRLVLASDVGGHRELITHGETGILFRAGSQQALADAVVKLVRCPQSWPALRRAARRYVERERNWEGSVARYDAIYRRLTGSTAS